MSQEFLDFDDIESPKARRARLLAEAEVRRQEEERVLAETRARSTKLTLRANESFLKAEFANAGVEPPVVDDRGVPTASLSMLLSLGWRIEVMGRDRTLVKP